MTKKESFLKRKNVEISARRYLQDALSTMALGLFASLLIGVIFNTIGVQTMNLFGNNVISDFFIDIGGAPEDGPIGAMDCMGAAIGAAVAWGLKAPPIVIFASVVTGSMGATAVGLGVGYTGGPAGAFIAAAVGAEFGKIVFKETKADILVTPAVTLITGGLSAKLVGPVIGLGMSKLGNLIETATEWQPFFFGIVISVVVGLVLTAPISSAALCIMLELSGLAAGAATVGCCAQMVGFAVVSYRENGIGGIAAQGIGTSMIQIPNIIKNPWILLPPTLAGAVIGPFATVLFKMTNIPIGAGMGTSGLVGQIGTFTDMGFSASTLWKILLLQIVLPAVLTIAFEKPLRRMHKIKDGDYKLDL